MSLSFGLSPLLLILCLLAAAGLAYWVYRHTVPELHPAKRFGLAALRLLSLGLVLFLLFKPVLQNISNTELPPVLAVLIDDSQSLDMTIEEESDSLSLSEQTRKTVREFTRHNIPGDVRYFRFSSQTEPIQENSGATADSLQFSGDRTNMSQALGFVSEQLKDQNLQGVLLISDGQYNTGRNPIYLAERYSVPIHTVVVGDTTRRRDLQIRRVTTNEIAYVDEELPIQVGLLSEDFEGERVTVSLFQNGVQLNSANVDLPAGTAEIPIDLYHTPATEGLHRYRVGVTRLNGEATFKNNTESFAVRVLENKKRILLLGAAPEPDVAAVQQLLAQNSDIEVSAFIQKSNGEFYVPGPIDSLDSYDAAILLGFPGRTADPAVVQRVASALENGLPAFFLLSRQTDMNLFKQHFENVLPVQPRVVRTTFVESVISPNPEGLQHPILQIPNLADGVWQSLPPLIYNDSRWQSSPDARVLATHKVRGIALDDPLLVVQNRNNRRKAALLGAGIWRWKNLPDDLAAAEAFWPTLFANILQWISTREDDRPVRVSPVADVFSGGSPIQFGGQVYDESLNPVDGASIEVDVIESDSITYPYTMEAIGNGRYTLNIGALGQGSYRYVARATKNGVELGEDEGAFAVGTLSLEYKETRANGPLMHQLAQRSGGRPFDAEQLEEVPGFLGASESFKPVSFEKRVETELWQRWIFFAIILFSLTAEWLVRKRSGMV